MYFEFFFPLRISSGLPSNPGRVFSNALFACILWRQTFSVFHFSANNIYKGEKRMGTKMVDKTSSGMTFSFLSR